MFETLDTIKRDWVEEHFAQMTTEEKLGFTGSGEGISVQAVCLIDN